jgi:hypothetical protein
MFEKTVSKEVESSDVRIKFMPRKNSHELCDNDEACLFFEKIEHLIYWHGKWQQIRFFPSEILGQVHGYYGA